MKDNSGSKQKVIAVFTAELSDAYQAAVWRGIQEKATQLGMGLICFLGSRIGSPLIPEATANIVYNLASSKNADGMIIISSAISTYLDSRGIQEFFAERTDLPQVSIGVKVPGYSSITVEGFDGMVLLVEHLIEKHNRKTFAMICGPSGHEEAESRKMAILHTLKKHKISVNNELFVNGTFEQQSGSAGVKELVRKGIPFDSLICLNDRMALGALKELHLHGFRIPEDISLVSFDDIEEARYSTPPLSTVMQPLHAVGVEAVEEIVRLLDGCDVRDRSLSCIPVIRESCGCSLKLNPTEQELSTFSSRLTGQDYEVVSSLLDLAREIKFDQFIASLNSALNRDLLNNKNLNKWYDYLAYISRTLGKDMTDSIEERRELFSAAFILIGKTQTRFQAARRLDSIQCLNTARLIGISLAEAFEVPIMLNRLAQGLRQLGFDEALLAVFDGRKNLTDRARLLISPDNISNPIEHGKQFSTSKLLPSDIDPGWRKKHWVLKPLVFQDEPLGYFMLPVDNANLSIYDTLSKQLAITLKGALLLEQVRCHEKSLEEIVAMRTTELTRTNKMLTKEIERRIRLEQEVIDISNQTMDRIGQDLHDDLCQHLAGISMLTIALKNSLPDEYKNAVPVVEQIDNLLVESIDRAKRIVRGLVSTEIREQGLSVSIDALVEAARKSYNINISFENSLAEEYPDTEKALQVYRIVQEALTNSIKHSNCTRVELKLYCSVPDTSDNNNPVLVAEVSDDGIGLPEHVSKEGMGLKIMRYRAEKAGAELTIERINPGTRVICKIPQN